MTVEGGYRYLKWNREFRDTQRDHARTPSSAAVNLQALGWAQLRASYEKGNRDRSHYDTEDSEDASFVDPGPLGEPPGAAALRSGREGHRPIQRPAPAHAVRRPVRLAFLPVRPRRFLEGADRRGSGLRYGLLDVKYRSFTAEADYSPGERWSVYGFYSREKITNLQRGRQSGATPSTNPLDDWTSDVDDEVDCFGGGATVGLLPEKLDFRASARYQKVDGNNDLSSPPGGTPDVAFPIAITTTRRSGPCRARSSTAWHASGASRSAAGSRTTRRRDSATTGLSNYVPGSFFLAANDGHYQARVGYLRASYRW